MEQDNLEESFLWPPPQPEPRASGLRFFRRTFDLQLADPASPDTVTVIVGQGRKSARFHFEKEMLQSSSEYFTRSLKSNWDPDTFRVISMPGIQPALFDLYARWLASGSEILTTEEDWKASFTEYLRWERDLEYDKKNQQVDAMKALCPGTVWDFNLTTKAWFLGDFLRDQAFQNHCMGHLFYMHLRYDHVRFEDLSLDDVVEGYWHWGTVAYVSLQDVVFTWFKTAFAPQHALLNDRHPLRRFYVYWLARYWRVYEISSRDDKAIRGIDGLMRKCPGMMTQIMYESTRAWVDYYDFGVGPLDQFYV